MESDSRKDVNDSASDKVKKKSGGRSCCVVGCGNNYNIHGKEIKFFKFPSRDQEQRQKWISAVKRVDVDGKPWAPKEYTRICSAHFYSGNWSRTRGHPDYVPSIFPTHHIQPKSKQDEDRFERREKRAYKWQSLSDFEDDGREEELERMWRISDEFAVQTEPSTSESDTGFSWSCDHLTVSMKKSDASTMASLPQKESRKTGTDYPLVQDSFTQASFSEKTRDSGFDFDGCTDRQFKAFTGVARNVFACILWLLGTSVVADKTVTRYQKLALFLVKLKLNISFGALSAMFSVGEEKASQIFHATLQAMVDIAPNGVVWLSKEQIQARMPASFRGLYPNCRVIIDCSEIAIERPKTLEQRVLTWSNYKGRHTVKFLIGCAPSGEITFISRTRGGRSTDSEITIDSGILNYIEVGDLVLADKGFPQIQSDVNNAGGLLVMPPFKVGNQQFSGSESKEAYECASVRVHVERCIARMKTFEILKFLSQTQLKSIDDILYVISFIVNFNQ